MQFYFLDLKKRMDAVGAKNLDEFVILAWGNAEEALLRATQALDGVRSEKSAGARRALLSLAKLCDAAGRPMDTEAVRYARANPPPECCDEHLISIDLRGAMSGAFLKEWVREAKLMNTRSYLAALMADPRYTRAANAKLPPKVGTRLALFNCITCDKCVPVCPNDANFTYELPRIEIPIVKVRHDGVSWRSESAGKLVFDKKHQLANFADFCNECGNCDVFCPEDGGPYILKPRFFGSLAQWELYPKHDGFYLQRDGAAHSVWGRIDGREMRLRVSDGKASFASTGFELRFDEAAPETTIEGTAAGEVDLTWFHVMNWLRKAMFETASVNYVNA